MRLGDYEDEYNKTEPWGGDYKANEMPDGQYTLRIVGFESKENPRDPEVLFNTILMEVEAGDYVMAKAQETLIFKSGAEGQKSRFISLAKLKAFLCVLNLENSLKIADLDQKATQDWIKAQGFIVEAIKKSRAYNGKIYVSWDFICMSRPAEGQNDTTPPPTGEIPNEEKQSLEECLSEEPFEN